MQQSLSLQALRIIIPGSYYDSQIYNGYLYLWDINGCIITLDWSKLIESINISEDLKVAFAFAFEQGDDLYSNLLLQDREIREILQKKFRELGNNPIEISAADLEKFTVTKQASPFPFPHADSAIHYRKLYVGSKSGVSSSLCRNNRINAIDPKPTQLWDGPVLSVSTSHSTLALATGSEGVFEYNLFNTYKEPKCIIDQHSNLVRWLYPSIFSSSYLNEGFFADFKRTRKKRSNGGVQSKSSEATERELIKVLPYSGISASSDKSKFKKFTWGGKDKIYFATSESIEIVRYTPQLQSKKKGKYEKFNDLGSVNIDYHSQDDIVSADSSFFGVVLELDDSLLIINSSLENIKIEGEPVNWRVFPKSKNYTNQLHIVYDDYLHIYSFVHDYFLPSQREKKIGISYGGESDENTNVPHNPESLLNNN